ncbi:MAG: prolyl oligopeptidase family serine peptidase [Acidobacteria bacterium]|nr:prolyl oligopeptidase family serine peptidase [Acidobacteriota bacterium]
MHTRASAIALFLLLLIPARAAGQPAPVFTAEDMLAVRTFAGGQPIAPSSTGRWVAYVLTDQDDEWNVQEGRPTGYVHVQTLGGAPPAAPRALTTAAAHSAFPVWSPDGRRLAFIREENGQGRAVIWEADRDETMPIGDTFTERLSLAPQWHPSGKTLIVAAALPDPPVQPYRVRSIKSSDARVPGDQPFTNPSQATLVSIDVSTGVSTTLTPDPIVLRSFQVSPTGSHIMYVAPAPETLGLIGKEQNDTFVLPVGVAGGAPPAARKLSERTRFSWSPDGRQLVFVRGGRLMVLPADGTGEPKPWLDALNLPVGEPVWSPDLARFATLVADPTVTDPELEPVKAGMYTTAQPFMDLYLVEADGSSKNLTSGFADQVSTPAWSPDGVALFFRAVDNVTYDETVYRYTMADQKLEPLIRGPESYSRLHPIAGGVIVAVEDATRPTDLWIVGADGQRTRMTTLNPQLARFTFSKPELFYFHSADGDRLGALLYKPVGLRPKDKVPVITWVYEKMTPARHRFNARDQVFISHGYAMLMPNVKVRVGQTADSFEKCVVPAVNAVRQMDFANGKFGLWGHSFGAYATSNLITRTDIFAAAVSGATPPELFRNWASGRDRDSRNIETGQARMGGSPFEFPERYFSQSAFFHLDKVNTPVLILHGEKDLTILFGEGEMMFYALRQLGKIAELVAYAHGDHSLSRHSRQDALDANRRILEWFDRYLKAGPGSRTQ